MLIITAPNGMIPSREQFGKFDRHKEEVLMEATVYILVDRPDYEKAKANLESNGWKGHGVITMTDSLKHPHEMLVMLKD